MSREAYLTPPVFKRSATYGNQAIELFYCRYARFFKNKIWCTLEVSGIKVDAPQEILAKLYNAILDLDEQKKENLFKKLEGA